MIARESPTGMKVLVFFDCAVVIVLKNCRVVIPHLIKTSYWHCDLAPLRGKTFRKNKKAFGSVVNRKKLTIVNFNRYLRCTQRINPINC